jgi:autotransporter-associated beta strand protein
MTMLKPNDIRVLRPCLTGLLVAVLASLLVPAIGQAQSTATWTGIGGSGDWDTTSNWTPGKPTTSGSWALIFGGNTQTTGTNNITGTITVNSLSFTNDGTTNKTSLFTLSGSTLALSSASITTSATTGGSLGSNAGDVVGNSATLTGVNTVSLGAGHNLTLSGGISGGGSLVMQGGAASQLFLSGNNSFSGGVTISAGAIQNGLQSSTTDFSSTAFGSGTVTVNAGGSAIVRNGSQIANNFTISGTGSASGADYGAIRGSFGTSGTAATIAGTVTLAGNATVTTAGSGGVSGSKLVLAGAVDLGSNALTLNPKTSGANPLPIEITGTISGAGSVVVNGVSTSSVLLSAANQYSGGTTIQSGTLRAGNSTALGSGTVAVNSGTLDLNGQALSIGTLSGSSGGLITTLVSGSASLTTTSNIDSTYAGAITDGAGTVSLLKTGTGSLFLTGSSGYSGGTRISGGMVQNGLQTSASDFNSNAFGTGDVTVDAGASAVIRNGSTIANNFIISGTGTGMGANYGAIRGSFGVSGTTATISGTVTLAGNATITSAAPGGVTNSQLVLAGPIRLGGNTLTLNPKASSGSPIPIVVEGAIDGSGSVVINGDSTAYLNAINTYTGPTTVQSGTLGGDGSVTGLVTVNSGAAISPGSALDTYGTFGVGSLQLDAGAIAALAIGGTSASLYDQIVATSSVTYGGSLNIDFDTNGFLRGDHWQLFTAPSSSGNFATISASGAYGNLVFNYAGNGAWVAEGGSLGAGDSLLFFTADVYGFKSGELVMVPEPSAIAIAGVGIVLIGVRYSRRRKTA